MSAESKSRPLATISKSRGRSRALPVHVVEDHNQALEHMYRGIGSKKLPLENNVLIHFDSHPDLLIPSSMPADLVSDKQRLFEELSIENWILPSAYAGHFSSIMWVKPYWAEQIADGSYSFSIGKDVSSGFIRVSSSLDYFVSDALYCPADRLENSREIQLEVVTLGRHLQGQGEEDDSLKISCILSKWLSAASPYILDVDLDFFSTDNPFKALYSNADLYQSLKPIYRYDPPPHPADQEKLMSTVEKRKDQLEDLKNLWHHVAQHGPESELQPSSKRWPAVQQVARQVMSNYAQIDWDLIHDAGCTCDDTELPQHISTREEIDSLLEQSFTSFLGLLPSPPTLITVSRSSEDDYCPPDDVDYIEENVIKIFKDKYNDIQVHQHYLED